MAEAPYQLGLTSLTQETRHDALPVHGQMPPWLQGTLVRNGPAKFEVGDHSYNHWFDGLAMLHAFTFSEGRVGYANRFLNSTSYAQAEATGAIQRSEFATDPCRSIFGRVMAMFRPQITDNANINVMRLADQYVALTETPLPIRFDPETLDTFGGMAYEDQVPGDITTAHPHVDPGSGTLYSYTTAFSKTSTYQLYKLTPGSRTRTPLGSLAVDEPAYMHSFAMTEQHLILAAFPFVVNPLELAFSGKPFIANYHWRPERGTQFHVFDRTEGTHLATCTGPAFFAFHHINAFVTGAGQIAVDLAGYPTAAVVGRLFLDRLRAGIGERAAADPWRFHLDLNVQTARKEVLSDTGLELPRIDYARVNGRPYRYVWGTGNRVPGHFTDQLVRIDVATGQAKTWHTVGCYPGEPVFVARPGATTEGDGVVLSVVLDAAAETSFLLVLDAATLHEQARATVPHPIPLGFHGQYLSGRADTLHR